MIAAIVGGVLLVGGATLVARMYLYKEPAVAANSGIGVIIANTAGSDSVVTMISGMAPSSVGELLLATDGAASGNIYRSTDHAVTWRPTASTGAWGSIVAGSTDGSMLLISNGNYATLGSLYTSTDRGATWTQVTSVGPQRWTGLCSSADGTMLAAAVHGGGIYTSVNGGTNWTPQPASMNHFWSSLHCSADGRRLTAVPGGDGVPFHVYNSINGGVTWSPSVQSAAFDGLAGSADGMILLSGNFSPLGDGQLYRSLDGGVNWNVVSAIGANHFWTGMAMSATGTHMIAAEYGTGTGGYLWLSNDSGVTWSKQAGDLARRWSGVSASADFTRLLASVDSGTDNYVFRSTDGGVTWSKQVTAGARQWAGVFVTTTPVSCGETLFSNWNGAACTSPTNSSTFTLGTRSNVTSLALWVDTSVAGANLSYTLTGPSGPVSSGPLTKGACEPYQKQWCTLSANLSKVLAAGTYTVRSSATSTCSNVGSANVGFVWVMGCAGG